MIHYHGTPLTPRADLQKMAGKHFCVSFARPDDAAWCLSHGQSVMWDNGAFSFYTRKQETKWNKFYTWLELVMNNWELFYGKYAKELYQKSLSVDLSAAIVAKILDCDKKITNNKSLFPIFIHISKFMNLSNIYLQLKMKKRH